MLIPEIQGLRALAVSLVVLFHLWPTRLPGGFVGVDVFFVVSGYLITAHLLKELDRTGRIGVVQFWARRMRRLLPASLTVLAATGVLVLALVPQNDWQSFFRHIIASTVYVENWALARDAVDYWAQGGATPPTQHYWSLGVEEQFYAVWPALFLLVGLAVGARLAHLRRRVLLAVLLLVVASSLAYSVWYTARVPDAAYFSTLTRAWQFGAGGLLVFLPALRWRPWVRTVLAWCGVAAIGASSLVLSEATAFPGYAALLPTAGTVAVIVAGEGLRGLSFSWLGSWRPVAWVGAVSYAIYLWHWPLIVFAPRVLEEVTFAGRVGIVALTVALAWLTKVLVEDPTRESAWLKARRSTWTFVTAGVASAAVVLGSVVASGAFERHVERELARAQAALESGLPCLGAHASADPACATSAWDGERIPAPDVMERDFDARIEACIRLDDSSDAAPCRFGEQDRPTARVALVGDSHAQSLAPAVRQIAEREGWALDVYLKTGCPWSEAHRSRPDHPAAAQHCAAWVSGVSAALADERAPYDAVVTTGFRVVANLVDAAEGRTPYETSVDGLLAAWSRTPARIIAVADNPDWPVSSITCLVDGGTDEECSQPAEVGFGMPDPLPEAAAVAGVPLVDLSDLYCPHGTCPSVMGGVTVYRDQHHLSGTFVASMTDLLADRLVPLVSSPATG